MNVSFINFIQFIFVLMANILSIDTATEVAVVALGNEKETLFFKENAEQKTHASFVQTAINDILHESDIYWNNICAIAVSNGPGSYTGLRVGLSSAKGIAYAVGKPLILLNTLEVMAQNAIIQLQDENALYCPMIDARRMEVFTGIYNISLNNLFVPAAVILNDILFKDFLNTNKMIIFGSGAEKSKPILHSTNAYFLNVTQRVEGLNTLAQKHFLMNNFADLAYAEPFYLKSFYTKQQQ